jgi:hypothetical protein
MFGMDLNAARTIVRMAARSAGLQAGRLDHDPQDGRLYLSVMCRGQVRQTPIPTGQVFTVDQLIEILFPVHVDPAIVAVDASPP